MGKDRIMALYKEIEMLNGVKTSYHRIEAAHKDSYSDEIEVNIVSYVSIEIRDKEIWGYSLMREYNQAITDGDESKAQKMREDYSVMLEKFMAVNGSLSVMNKVYEISLEDLNGDISFKSIYEYLKTIDDFESAEDI